MKKLIGLLIFILSIGLVGGVDAADSVNAVYISGKYAYVGSGAASDALAVFDIGGIDAPSANIGDLAASTIDVTENLQVANDVYIGNGLVVGSGGIYSQGGLSVVNDSYFGGKIGIGKPSPKVKLDVNGAVNATSYLTEVGAGFTGSCASSTTLTVQDGIIVACA